MIPTELKQKGYLVLVKELGQVDTIRFLLEMGCGNGDYTKERQDTLKDITRSEFWGEIEEMRKEQQPK